MKKDILTWFEFNTHAHYHQPPDSIRTPYKIKILISNMSLWCNHQNPQHFQNYILLLYHIVAVHIEHKLYLVSRFVKYTSNLLKLYHDHRNYHTGLPPSKYFEWGIAGRTYLTYRPMVFLLLCSEHAFSLGWAFSICNWWSSSHCLLAVTISCNTCSYPKVQKDQNKGCLTWELIRSMLKVQPPSKWPFPLQSPISFEIIVHQSR